MLALATIHLVIQKKGVADAVLPSKLTNILSAGGQAIVTAESGTELGDLSQRFPGIFMCIEPESLDTLVAAIDSTLKNEADEKNKVARQFAEQYLDKRSIINHYATDIRNIY